MTHKERARAVYYDWHDRCLQSGGHMFIGRIDVMELAITAALKEVEAETARRCAEIAEAAFPPYAKGWKTAHNGGVAAAEEIRAAFPEVKNG